MWLSAQRAQRTGIVAKHGIDVALLDIEMPGKHGLDAAAELEGIGCRSLIVTTFGRSGYVKRALETCVAGFVVKDTPPEQPAEAIRRVHAGLKVIDPALWPKRLFSRPTVHLPHAKKVTRHALEGSDTRQIAGHLHLSTGTVRNIVSSLIAKTETGNRFEAATTARARGWI